MEEHLGALINILFALTVLAIVRSLINKSKKVILEEIDSKTEEDMLSGDIFLKITSKVVHKHRTAFTAEGLFRGTRVGLIFDVVNNVEPLYLDGNPMTPNKNSQGGFIKDGVILRSLGQKSDDFIVALSTLYGMPTTKKFTKHEVKTTSTSFASVIADFKVPGYYPFKLFSQETEELYCEIFCNINTKEGIIEFHEKDESYRPELLQILTA